ncbi:MAG: hypothetical protein U1F60_07805 [Planctomycetota bacterium]
MRAPVSTFLILCSCLCVLPAQGTVALPATANPNSELPNFSLVPFMQPNARVQMFYDAAEVGGAPFVADRMSMRFDGPIPQVGAPGPFTIARLQVRVGVTDVLAPGMHFQSNLTAPTTTVFDGPVTYLPDSGSQSPGPWGGTNDTLSFPFSAPLAIAVNPGQWLVVELVMEGNNIASFGFAHAIVDGITATGGATNGTTTTIGAGCSVTPNAPAASLVVDGLVAPGGTHYLKGQNLGSNRFGAVIVGFSEVPGGMPIGQAGCNLFVTPDAIAFLGYDANGALPANGIPLSIPANPAFSGVWLFEQLASADFSLPDDGIVMSNALQVTMGTFTMPDRGVYMVAHDLDDEAEYANMVKPFGFAVRFRTL